jgi:hypothetical protein
MAHAERKTELGYRIEVRGRMPAGSAAELMGFTFDVGSANTTLSGAVVDAAALYGLIARLEALGLALVSVRPDPESQHERS